MKLLAVLTIDTCIVVLEFCRALLKVCSIKRLDKIQRPPSPPWTIISKNGWLSWKCTRYFNEQRNDFYLDWVRKSAIYFFNVFGKNTGEMKKNWVELNVGPENE